jgi:hypothetical protein
MKEYGEDRPRQGEINKQLARARRLGHRKECQTIPHYIPAEQPPLEEAEAIIWQKQIKGKIEEQGLERLILEEEDRHDIEVGFDDLKESRIMSHRINRSLHYRGELLDKMQQHDPHFMNPILRGLKKRPERQAKAERAIERRHIDPGVDDYGDYIPLWERF